MDTAIFLNDAAAVERLLNDGANVNANIGEHGETALILAAQFADARMVRLLLEKGAEVEARDFYQRTALFCAPVPSEIFDILLDKGADLQVRNVEGETKLMKIVSLAAPLEAVKELMNRGIDLNAKSNGGETALSLAKDSGFVAVARLLEKAGAKD